MHCKIFVIALKNLVSCCFVLLRVVFSDCFLVAHRGISTGIKKLSEGVWCLSVFLKNFV